MAPARMSPLPEVPRPPKPVVIFQRSAVFRGGAAGRAGDQALAAHHCLVLFGNFDDGGGQAIVVQVRVPLQ